MESVRLPKLVRFKALIFTLVFIGFAASTRGQIQPDVITKLQSDDWTDRQLAYKVIASKKERSAEENTALVLLCYK